MFNKIVNNRETRDYDSYKSFLFNFVEQIKNSNKTRQVIIMRIFVYTYTIEDLYYKILYQHLYHNVLR